MIKFEKVSFEQFKKDCKNLAPYSDEYIKEAYDNLKIPRRSTDGSAGYDFYIPFTTNALGKEVIDAKYNSGIESDKIDYHYVTIPTGIRFVTDRKDIVLFCAPRSGLGFKCGFRLSNTLGVIDSDYCNSDNEGHIMAKFNVEFPVTIEAGKAFMQGVIMSYLTVDEDNTSEKRNGGFGSTDKN